LKLKNAEFNCVILARSLSGGNLENAYLNLGFKVVKMPLGYFNVIRAIRFYEFIRRERFDTVCDFNANFSAIVIMVSWLAGIRKRISFYRQASDHFHTNFFKRIYNLLLNRIVLFFATNILSNSASSLIFFFKDKWRDDKRFKIIYNGVQLATDNEKSKYEIRKQLNFPDNCYVIGHCGRLDKVKNQDTILKVFQHLSSFDTSYRLVLVGDGTERLAGECQKLNIEHNVQLLGYRVDVHSVMSAFDCFLFPSRTEGQPNALIEAWLLKIPTVVSNIPPIAEIIPKELLSLSKDPDDVNGYCEIIKKMRSKKEFYDLEQVRAFAEVQFNPNIRFAEFTSVLLS
jgi:glycosyltransferase involved in cell wall biosynthesis